MSKPIYFERKLKGMPSAAIDVFSSVQKAMWVAKGRWAEDPDPDLWESFVVRYGNETIIKRK